MKTYKIIASREFRYAAAGYMTALTEDVLAEALAAVVVRELSTDGWDHHTIDVRLDRPTDEQALDEIVHALGQLGFVVLKVGVSQWVNEAVDKAILGAVGGGGAGALSRDPIIAFGAAVAGAIVGGLAGAGVEKLVAEYDATRDYHGRWSFRQLPEPPAQGLQPGFSLA